MIIPKNDQIKAALLLCFLTVTSFFSPTALTQEEAPHRIISLAPHITELLFAVGAGDAIVGTVSFSDYPIEAEAIPRIGSADQINFEQILALKPTLIFGWRSGNGEEALNRLRSLDLSVHSHEPKSLEDVLQSLKRYGELTGNTKQGLAAAEQFQLRLEQLQQRYEHQTPMRVFYQLWHEPKMTINDKHLISDVIRLCGGTNVFGDAIPLVPTVNIETVIQRAPEVIFASGIGGERPTWLDDWNQWPSIPAVENEQLFHIHPDFLHRHSPRILDGAEQMCEHLNQARATSQR